MKKKIAYLTLLVVVSATTFFIGKGQAKTQTVNAVPDNCISLDECIPLKDIACCYIGENGYPCFELKDVRNQLDDSNNRGYADIMESLKK